MGSDALATIWACKKCWEGHKKALERRVESRVVICVNCGGQEEVDPNPDGTIPQWPCSNECGSSLSMMSVRDALAHLKMEREATVLGHVQATREQLKFKAWWRDDEERAKCTLEQAIGAYVSTFPGRLYFLLVELLEHLR